MPADTIILLGVMGRPAIEAILQEFDFVNRVDWKSGDIHFDETPKSLALQSTVLDAQLQVLEETGYRCTVEERGTEGLSFFVEYQGKRFAKTRSITGLYAHFEGELYSDPEKHTFLGVSLTSRYAGSFLDVEYDYGQGSMAMDAAKTAMFDKLKSKLTAAYPFISKMDMVVTQFWY